MHLVTGATGFIGKRLVARLLDDGHELRALLLPDEQSPFGGDVQVVRGDVTDAESLRSATGGASRVYHLAAFVGDWGDEDLIRAINVTGTRNVLEAAVASACERFVMVSSVVVYGSQLWDGDCDEDAPREHGCGPYSRTKRESEELALGFDSLGRIPVSVVRPGNVYGPGSKNWVDLPVSALRAGQWIHVDGGDGDATLAYVDNVVDVIARAGDSEKAAGRIYNANDGSGVTWRQYAGDLARIAGAKEPTRSIPRSVALALGWTMERGWKLFRRSGRPLITREAVTLLASRACVPIERARRELDYDPPVDYRQAMEQIAQYIKETAT